MKKILNLIKNSKYKKFIFIGLIFVVLIIFILLITFLFRDKEELIYDYYDKQNSNIVVSKDNKEIPGTFIRSIETLKKEHCKDDICISNVQIFYRKNQGRIEYEITNKSKKKVTGAFKLKFDNGKVTYVVFSKLKKGETRKGTISYTDTDYSNVYDYSIKKLSDKELKKLLNSK